MRIPVARSLFAVHSVPTHVVVITVGISYLAQMAAIIQGWPLWAIGLATVLPWIPLVTMEMVWTYAHYEWLALFYLLVVTQTGHFFEHLSQMFEIHVLGLHGLDARGIFGQLDVEWVHFTWNTWVLVAVVLLLTRFKGNPWLWLTLALAGWHETEHLFIMMRTYLTSGVAGSPGLLSHGGAIAGGLPLSRPDLHFIYNLFETIPLIIGFVYQLRSTYDGWLHRAFPGAPERALVSATNRCQTVRFSTGDTIVEQGQPSDRLYIVSKRRGQRQGKRRRRTGDRAADPRTRRVLRGDRPPVARTAHGHGAGEVGGRAPYVGLAILPRPRAELRGHRRRGRACGCSAHAKPGLND